MKEKIEELINEETQKLKTMKENRSKEFDKLSDEELNTYTVTMEMTAKFIQNLKNLLK